MSRSLVLIRLFIAITSYLLSKKPIVNLLGVRENSKSLLLELFLHLIPKQFLLLLFLVALLYILHWHADEEVVLLDGRVHAVVLDGVF